MDPILKSVQDYIKSDEYFNDAREWYNLKYIYPLSQRSYLICLCSVGMLLLATVIINIQLLLPIIVQVRYSLYTAAQESTASVKKADQVDNDAIASIADIMVKSYLTKREEYDYNRLKQQFMFVQNNSTRLVFRKFFNYMSIDNPLSPVMRYGKYTKRTITILSASYPSSNEALITFHSIANDNTGTIFEDIIWQAQISYDMDDINLNAPSDSKFNFVITNYYLKLLKNNTKK